MTTSKNHEFDISFWELDTIWEELQKQRSYYFHQIQHQPTTLGNPVRKYESAYNNIEEE